MTEYVDEAAGGAVTELWSLRSDVLIETDPADGALTLLSRSGEVVIRSAGPLLRGLLGRMQLGPTRLENALDVGPGPRTGAVAERAALMFAVSRLQHLVVRSLATGEGAGVLLSVEPVARRAEFRPRPPDPDLPVRLSSFAVLRTEAGLFQAESPLSLHRVLLHQTMAGALAAALARPRTLAELGGLVAGPSGLLRAAVSYLLAAGIVVQAVRGAQGPEFAEDQDPVLRMWSPVDLMFHTRSTMGRHGGDFGATYPLGSNSQPEPDVKARPEAGRIALHRPRIEEVLEGDAPFTAVLEARRSTTRFGALPPTVRELGDLLYRAVRIRARITREGGDPAAGCLQDRPYPAGGAMHELEFYITVDRCEGLEPGVYAYDALRHELVPITSEPRARRELLNQARLATEPEQPPPVLITITARFRRIFWKYSAVGYSLILKDAGVVLQTLQLVATALGLAACPIGGCEIEDTPAVLGLDWRVESGVGALVLGRAPQVNAGSELSPGSHPANDPQWRDICRNLLPDGLNRRNIRAERD
jgi:SagB-type dehydrogenase family enzyme